MPAARRADAASARTACAASCSARVASSSGAVGSPSLADAPAAASLLGPPSMVTETCSGAAEPSARRDAAREPGLPALSGGESRRDGHSSGSARGLAGWYDRAEVGGIWRAESLRRGAENRGEGSLWLRYAAVWRSPQL